MVKQGPSRARPRIGQARTNFHPASANAPSICSAAFGDHTKIVPPSSCGIAPCNAAARTTASITTSPALTGIASSLIGRHSRKARPTAAAPHSASQTTAPAKIPASTEDSRSPGPPSTGSTPAVSQIARQTSSSRFIGIIRPHPYQQPHSHATAHGFLPPPMRMRPAGFLHPPAIFADGVTTLAGGSGTARTPPSSRFGAANPTGDSLPPPPPVFRLPLAIGGALVATVSGCARPSHRENGQSTY